MTISRRILLLYVTGGLVAAASQTTATLIAGTSGNARVPMLGASGAIAVVLGAYLVRYPLYQLVEARVGLYSAGAGRGGTAFFARIGRFVFGAAIGTSLVTGWHKAHTFRRPGSQTGQ
jgi:rhomboid family protein